LSLEDFLHPRGRLSILTIVLDAVLVRQGRVSVSKAGEAASSRRLFNRHQILLSSER